VLLDDGEVSYLFAGDTSSDEAQLVQGIVGGISADVGQAQESQERIRAFLAARPTVYLPSHDPQSTVRLTTRQVTSV
jgi:glyoxylase-like metal-dependent hydrolase (beta-lactamase superfamily II)